MKSNGLNFVLLLCSLGLGGWAAWEHRQRMGLENRLASLTQERDVLRVTAGKKLALEAKTDVKSDGPQGLGPDHAQALEEELKQNGKPAGPQADQNPMSAMAEMMKDPAMREALKSQMRTQVDMQYRDLFDLLALDEEKKEQLGKLLLDRTSAGMELGMSMMSGTKLSAEEQKKKTEEMKAVTDASDKALKELLGEADYQQFDSFEKSQPERQQLSALNGQLKDQGIALSEEAESKLMDAMFEERSNFKYDVDFSDKKSFDPAKFTEENMSRFQEQQAVLRGKVLARAEPILTPEQLDVFRKSQEQQAAMEKMGMQMGLKMMRGQQPE